MPCAGASTGWGVWGVEHWAALRVLGPEGVSKPLCHRWLTWQMSHQGLLRQDGLVQNPSTLSHCTLLPQHQNCLQVRNKLYGHQLCSCAAIKTASTASYKKYTQTSANAVRVKHMVSIIPFSSQSSSKSSSSTRLNISTSSVALTLLAAAALTAVTA